MSRTLQEVEEIGPAAAASLSRKARAWCLLRRGALGEAALHEFAMFTRRARPDAEMRDACVAAAAGIAGALRVVLEIDAPAERGRRLLTSWPKIAGESDGQTSFGRSTVEGPPAFEVELESAGRRRGLLRIWTRWGLRPSPVTTRRLITLAALAAAVERASGSAYDEDVTRDPLSGARNGPFLNAFLTHAVAQARRRSESLSLLMIALDGLPVPSESGERHEFLDAWLHRAARALSCTLRTSDVIARLESGPFVAVLPGAGAADAMVVAEAVGQAIKEAGIASGSPAPLRATIGVAGSPDHGREAGALLAAAAEALAGARRSGEGRIALAQRSGSKPTAVSLVTSAG